MRVLVQRVLDSHVMVHNKRVGEINKGLTLLVGFTEGDSEKEIDEMVKKVIHLRIFDDENGVMNLSLQDINGSILSISQFTLYADASKGRRPSYVNALHSEKATLLYDIWNKKLKETGIHTETGIFGADMKVHITNDGPVTIWLESGKKNE
ncbi:MAG: D-aminoacyl-tRNA deacylase [Bacilli bacterium]|nr:D-aminoacyl-tRNA deacylase [Bacilli bacterium]